MLRVLQIFYVLLLVGCATPASTINSGKPLNQSSEQRRLILIGKWYGEAPTKDGLKQLELVEKRVDGTQKIHFKLTDKFGKVMSDTTEVGDWGVSGPIYFSITRGWLHDGKVSPTDPTSAFFYDAYEILELTETTFRYKSVETGDQFVVRKVSDSFQMPQ
ncbi:MAG TPA: hypothetical protein VFK88_13890 [Gallionella sp.]|nr:hypothetical protein [Gallionella sp.]